MKPRRPPPPELWWTLAWIGTCLLAFALAYIGHLEPCCI